MLWRITYGKVGKRTKDQPEWPLGTPEQGQKQVLMERKTIFRHQSKVSVHGNINTVKKTDSKFTIQYNTTRISSKPSQKMC